ncbi:XrtA/PEP-CTERM system TPR-repeat protein PrsT [Colwellia sp. TT2012]|uniref:XrtA/PEP-CTERM system TPR-repeat protein PrsT n=1 Tax=Colwellia sp. TT2012 TaxID=1720342 RepID=UPI00070C15DB|nr:XrtA/PEP-CTERM system TPR-repeat protein PrsT [Colwellia sp. TT2012]
MNFFLKACLGLTLVINTLLVFASEDIDNNYEKALISFQKKDIKTSLIHLRNVLQADENHMPARLLLVRSYLELGDGIAAEFALEKTNAEQVDNKQIITLYAHAYLLQKQFDKVIEATEPGFYQGLVEHDLQVFRGQAYIGLKQYRSAEYAFKEALLIKPESQLALLGRAQIALGYSKPKLALDYIEQAILSNESFINTWIFKAKVLQQMRFTKDALVAIDKALAIDDSHMSARLTKAMLLMSSHSYKEAEEHVDYILNIIANEPRAGYLKAIILASYNSTETQSGNNKLAEVIVTLSAVPEDIMRNTPDYYYLAGQSNYQFGNLTDARKYLIKFLKYSEHEINSVLMIASIDLQQGEPRTARNLLVKTNLSRPNDIRILTLLGLAYLQLHNTDKAEFYFEKVLKIKPDSAVGLTNIARSKMQSGNYESAIKVLLSIEDKNIDPVRVRLLLVDSYQQSKQIKKAIKVSKELLAAFPEDSFFHQRIGALYGLNNDLPLARSAFIKAIALDESNIVAIVHLARMDNIAGKSADALQFLQSKLKQFPKNTLIMAEISDSYYIAEDQDNRLLWMKKAYAMEMNNFYIVNKYASALVSNNNLQEAIEITKRHVERNRKELIALDLLASLYSKNREYGQVVSVLTDLVKKSDVKAPVYMKLAKAQRQANNNSAAIQYYKKAIIADDKYLDAYFALVELIINKHDKVYANILINDIEKLTGNKSQSEMLKGALFFELGLFTQAETHYLASISLVEQKKAIIGLYNTYKKSNRAEKAIPYLTHWLAKNPNDLLVNISLADSYRYSQQLQKSFDLYLKMLTNFGQLPILLNNIAIVSFKLGEKEQAKKYAEQAYSYLKSNVAVIDTLAWIESRLGNYDRALALFRKALAKDYENAEVKYHLAVTLYALGRDGEAYDLLLASVNSAQTFAEKSDAKELLTKKKL